MNDDDVEAIGWNAIDAALVAIYGNREPKHYGVLLPMSLGGNDPLNGISVYKNISPQPHYHYVTYGFSELYEKETEDPDYSGYGFELTFRLACLADAPEDPPIWPLNFLQNLARYVFSSGNEFDERHHLMLNGPIALGEETQITAIMLVLDPELQEIDTPNGHVKFLQIVGLCTDEYGLVQQGYFGEIEPRVAALSSLQITDLSRSSILTDQAVINEIMDAGPGDTQAEVFGTIATWQATGEQLRLEIGATVVPQLKAMLATRLVDGQPIAVYGKETVIGFDSGEATTWNSADNWITVKLSPEVALELANNLESVRGDYIADKLLTVTVVPVDIKDAAGKVVETIG